MRIGAEDIERFRDLFREHCGAEVSDSESREMLYRLFMLFEQFAGWMALANAETEYNEKLQDRV